MSNNISTHGYELIFVIVNFNQAGKVLKVAKKTGITGGTVFLGTGTIKSRLLEFLALTDVRKEIVWMVADVSIVEPTLQALDEEFEFKKPYHGIAFTVPLTSFLRSGSSQYVYNKTGGKAMYQSIITIVEQDKGELVLEAASSVGAGGGTVIRGRGASAHEASKWFNMHIEPEKEIVLILSETTNTEKIVTAIRDKLDIDSPGKGIIFCHDLNKVYGLFNASNKS